MVMRAIRYEVCKLASFFLVGGLPFLNHVMTSVLGSPT